MSDHPSESGEAVAIAEPEVVIAKKRDGALLALVHLGQKFRQIFANDAPSLRTQLASVAISEFGVDPDAASHFADHTLHEHQSTVDELARLQEELPLLREELTEAQADLDKHDDLLIEANKTIAERDDALETAKKTVAEHEAAIAERDGKIEVLEKQVDDLRQRAAQADADPNAAASKPVGRSAARGAGQPGSNALQSQNNTPPSEAGAAAGASDGPAAAAAPGGNKDTDPANGAGGRTQAGEARPADAEGAGAPAAADKAAVGEEKPF